MTRVVPSLCVIAFLGLGCSKDNSRGVAPPVDDPAPAAARPQTNPFAAKQWEAIAVPGPSAAYQVDFSIYSALQPPLRRVYPEAADTFAIVDGLGKECLPGFPDALETIAIVAYEDSEIPLVLVFGRFDGPAVGACLNARLRTNAAVETVHGHEVANDQGVWFASPAPGLAVITDRATMQRVLDPNAERAGSRDPLARLLGRVAEARSMRFAVTRDYMPRIDLFLDQLGIPGDPVPTEAFGFIHIADLWEFGATMIMEDGVLDQVTEDTLRANWISELAVELGSDRASMAERASVRVDGTALVSEAKLTPDEAVRMLGLGLGAGARTAREPVEFSSGMDDRDVHGGLIEGPPDAGAATRSKRR